MLSDRKVDFLVMNEDDINAEISKHLSQLSRQCQEALARGLCLKVVPGTRFITFLSWLLYPFYQLPFYPAKEEMRAFEVSLIVFSFWV